MEKKTYKDSLLKYLCMALPYGVMMNEFGQAKKLVGFHPFKEYCVELDNGEYMPQLYTIEECKLYLRPMSSMTEEEKKELKFMCDIGPETLTNDSWINGEFGLGVVYKNKASICVDAIDWLLKNHFDFMGLIPMNAAIDCTDLNVY